MAVDYETCPFCVEPIPSGSRRCPHCGQPIRLIRGSSDVEDDLQSEPLSIDDHLDAGQLPAGDWDASITPYLDGPDLRGALLSGADLFDADLRQADLRGADLGGAMLSEANLRGADLRGANLADVDLSHANLCGADLCEADLSRADLTGARYDSATIWPDRYDPDAAGAARIHEG